MKLVLKQIDKFEQELDSLITKYSDLSYEELADSLEYYSDMCRRKENKL